MDCDEAAELISADLDGELDDDDAARLDEHLATCVECRQLRRELGRVRRMRSLTSVDAVPDLTDTIMARTALPSSAALDALRLTVVGLGLLEIIAGARDLSAGDVAESSIHLSRHAGTLAVGLGVTLLYAAWRPLRAIAALPMMLTVGVLGVATAWFDVRAGRANALAEVQHGLQAIALWALWRIAGRPTRS